MNLTTPRHLYRIPRLTLAGAAVFATLCAFGAPRAAHAETASTEATPTTTTPVVLVAQLSETKTADNSIVASQPISIQAPKLVNLSKSNCGIPGVPGVTSLNPFPIYLRAGALLTPHQRFDFGIDATVPGLHFLPTLSTRLDADAILAENFDGIASLFPVTVDQIYTKRMAAGSSVYLGAGAGPYFGGVTRFGGKVVAGLMVHGYGLESALHFSGQGNPLFTLQARFGL